MQLGHQPHDVGDQHDHEGAGEQEHDSWHGDPRAAPRRDCAHQPQAQQRADRVGAGRDERGEREIGARGCRQHEVHPGQDRTGDREQSGVEERRAVAARSATA